MSKDIKQYPRIVGYKITITADWADGETEDIDISNVEIHDMDNVLEGLENERATDLGWRQIEEEIS